MAFFLSLNFWRLLVGQGAQPRAAMVLAQCERTRQGIHASQHARQGTPKKEYRQTPHTGAYAATRSGLANRQRRDKTQGQNARARLWAPCASFLGAISHLQIKQGNVLFLQLNSKNTPPICCGAAHI
nr:hypothetical protein [Pandoravirus massiliensis]